MSKKQKKKEKFDVSKITMVPMLIVGIVITFGTAIAQSLIPDMSASLRNILYFVGIAALVIYMFQIAFEKRTGQKDGSESASKQGKKRK